MKNINTATMNETINNGLSKAQELANSEQAAQAKKAAKTVLSLILLAIMVIVKKFFAMVRKEIAPQLGEIKDNLQAVLAERPKQKGWLTLALRVWRLTTYAQLLAAAFYFLGGDLGNSVITAATAIVLNKGITLAINTIEAVNTSAAAVDDTVTEAPTDPDDVPVNLTDDAGASESE